MIYYMIFYVFSLTNLTIHCCLGLTRVAIHLSIILTEVRGCLMQAKFDNWLICLPKSWFPKGDVAADFTNIKLH